MAGTNAVAFKRALIARLENSPLLEGTKVSYFWPGDDDNRELVHLGTVEGVQDFALFRGGGARLPRNEELVVKLHVVVTKPGTDPDEVEARATEIGAVVENVLASDPELDDIEGILYSGITGIFLDSSFDDDGSIALLTYDIRVKSRLR